ncbi:hypothetical protein, partial [Streptomyces sp. WAC05292]|uniref:hypothetical protein n=1 Tax=Streptomyces sp. WAC05292 TaxID=2487418 RepID=UPI001C8E2F34
PFLENSTACQKSTPEVDTPSTSVDEVPLKKTCGAAPVALAGNKHSEDAVVSRSYSDMTDPLTVMCAPDYR